jgi:hypothetical protein
MNPTPIPPHKPAVYAKAFVFALFRPVLPASFILFLHRFSSRILAGAPPDTVRQSVLPLRQSMDNSAPFYFGSCLIDHLFDVRKIRQKLPEGNKKMFPCASAHHKNFLMFVS